MARALAPMIRVNVVCPGFIATRWYEDRLSAADYEALLQRMSAILPLAQPGTAEEVADGILFFCAEGANLVTGETLIMDRSEEHTSELQSLMRISYAVFCLKNKNTKKIQTT